MDQNKLNFKVYQWSINNNNMRYKHWALRVKDMFHQVGLYYNFTAEPDTLSKGYIQETINTHLKAQFNNEWKNELEREHAQRGSGRNKLRTYRQLKSEYCEEKYVNIIMPKIQRSSYAKFRMGVAPLRLETGRYEHLTKNRRVCFNCPNEVESEEHVIMDCPVYSDLRSILFSKIAQHIPEFYTKTKHEKFICVLSCDVVPVIRISAKICNDILMLRRQFLYK